MRWRGVSAWLALGSMLVLAGTIAALYPLGLAAGPPHQVLVLSASFLVYGLVGVLITVRRSSHRVGWLFCWIGLTGLASGLVEASALSRATIPAYPELYLAGAAAVANLWVVTFTLLPLLFLIFPDGRLPSRAWRPVWWLVGAVIVVGVVTSGRDDLRLPLDSLVGPDVAFLLHNQGQGFSGLGMAVLYLIGPIALVIRLRRARGLERQQLKWFAYAGLLLGSVFMLTLVAFFTPPLRALDPTAEFPVAMFGGVPFLIALITIPIAVGIAVLRDRLYDIDLLINRTLVYGAVSATLVAVYIGLVIALQGVLSGFTGGSSLAVAASTLAVAALFQPVRRRIQSAVDRRFYRSGYDAARTLEAFSSRLRHEVDLAHLTDELRGVVAETLRPASVSVWLREGRVR